MPEPLLRDYSFTAEDFVLVMVPLLIELVAIGIDEKDPARNRIADERLAELANKIDDIGKRTDASKFQSLFAKLASNLMGTEHGG